MRTIALVILVSLAGCTDDEDGGGSQLVVDLALPQSIDLCEDYPSRTIICDGVPVDLGPGSCDDGFAAESTCRLTVSDVRRCYSAIDDADDADLCGGALPDECAELADGSC